MNVGAIVGSEESSEWSVRQVANPTRARRIDDRGSLSAVWDFLSYVSGQIDRFDASVGSLYGPEAGLTEQWLRDLYAMHRNVVQLSPPAPILADAAEEAMDLVFDNLVVDLAQRSYRFAKKNSAVAALRQAYRSRSIHASQFLYERCPVATANHRTQFDFVVANGKVVQLAHTWSFQIPDQDDLSEQVKAWGWTVQDIRKGGGSLERANLVALPVPHEVDLEVVYVPPNEARGERTLAEAQSIFDTLGVVSCEIGEAIEVGCRAAKLLQQSGALLPDVSGD